MIINLNFGVSIHLAFIKHLLINLIKLFTDLEFTGYLISHPSYFLINF